jgi:PIN domain nuclease of toxin-antitoxin system
MNDYVTDTHALFWYMLASPLLSVNAKNAFDEGKQGKAFIHIPAIVFAELYYTNIKLKNKIDFAAEFQKIKQSGQFIFVSFEAEDVLDFD